MKALRGQIAELETKLARYYDAFENGTLDPEDVGDRVKDLNVQKKLLENEVSNRTSVKELPPHLTSPENIALIRDVLTNLIFTGTPQTVKRYLGILIEDIVLDGKQVTIRVKNDGILGFLEQERGLNNGRVTPVLNSVYKWRPKCTAVKYSVHSFRICDNMFDDNILRFNPIQIGEWLNELWEQKFHSQYKLAEDVGMSRVRVQQYLYLLRIPADLLGRLRVVPGLTEGELRPLTQMDGRGMRLAVVEIVG